MPRVRLIVLNFNGGDDVLRCVGQLMRTSWPRDRLDVVVIDNASTDGSADTIAAAFPSVRLVRRRANGGFPANNDALHDLGDFDFVGLVNNDAFVDTGFLAPLVDTLAQDASLGAACPKILRAERYAPLETRSSPGARLEAPRAVVGDGWTVPDDLVDPRPLATASSGRIFIPVDETAGTVAIVATDRGPADAHQAGPPIDLVNNIGNHLVSGWFGADRGLDEPDVGQYDVPAEVPAWCGAAVLLRTDYLRDVGLFDERLFLYYEDLDLAWRGRARGWRYRTVPASIVRHRLGASSSVGSPRFRYYVERNRLVVLAKNAPLPVALGAAVRHLLATGSYGWRDVVVRLAQGRRPSATITVLRLRSFGGFLRLLPHAARERRRIANTAVVPASDRLHP